MPSHLDPEARAELSKQVVVELADARIAAAETSRRLDAWADRQAILLASVRFNGQAQ